MQQNDFRALLSSRPTVETPPAYIPVKQRKADQLGKGEKPQEGFQPRSAKSKGKQKDENEDSAASQWRDRAKERREGLEDVARPSKGLDFAALERDRQNEMAQAELAAEDDLEAAFLDPEPRAPTVKKKTREEILAELREQQAASKGTSDQALTAARTEGKFKRVGQKDKPKAATATVVDPKTGKVKKLRKKKKDDAAADVKPTPTAPWPAQPAPMPVVAEAPAIQDDNEEEVDIFADANDYDPFQSEDEEDGAAEKSATKPHVKLFDDDDEEIRAEPLAAPAQRPSAPSAPTASPSKSKRQTSDSEEDDERHMRLEGFADSNDIRSLLEIDKAALKDEKRREQKERKRAIAAGEAPPPKKQKTLTDKDKLNRDFLEYSNYVAKKG